MTPHPLRLVWVAPQRVGSTVLLDALAEEVTFYRALFRKNKGPEHHQQEVFRQFPEFSPIRYENPSAAMDLLYANTTGPSVFKVEYNLLFGGDQAAEPWRAALLDMLSRPDLTILHGWRKDLYRRFISMVGGRRSGVMNRQVGEAGETVTFSVTLDHAVQNIERIVEQTRIVKAAYGSKKVHYIDYDEISDRSVFGRLTGELGLALSKEPEYGYERLIKDPRDVCLNYDEVRAQVIEKLGPWVVDCDAGTL